MTNQQKKTEVKQALSRLTRRWERKEISGEEWKRQADIMLLQAKVWMIARNGTTEVRT